MLGEQLDRADVSARGVLGDRAYGLVEPATGKVVSAKNVKAYPALLQCRAAFVAPTRLDAPLPPVRITLANGERVDSDAPHANARLSAFFGRDVELRATAPEDFTIDEYRPDLDTDELGPEIAAPLGAALWGKLGVRSPVPNGAFFDAFPLSLLTSATLEALQGLQPKSRFDERRFRMNVIVKAIDVGFPENGWVGRTLAIGDALRIRITMPDPRCIVTTLEQDGLPRDMEVLRTLRAHNGITLRGATGESPCAGVYAVVTTPGEIAVGDPVRPD